MLFWFRSFSIYRASSNIELDKRYKLLIMFTKLRKTFRNEKLFITFILNYLLIRSDDPLENVSFM